MPVYHLSMRKHEMNGNGNANLALNMSLLKIVEPLIIKRRWKEKQWIRVSDVFHL